MSDIIILLCKHGVYNLYNHSRAMMVLKIEKKAKWQFYQFYKLVFNTILEKTAFKKNLSNVGILTLNGKYNRVFLISVLY